MIMNLSGGGKAKNVLAIWNGDSGATITATLGTKVLTTETDSSGYAFLTNLDAGTWTLQATKTGRYVGAKTITITAAQTAYYIKYPFRTYVYDGSLNDGGEHGANICEAFSGGWTGYGGGGTTTYNLTNINRTTTAQYKQSLVNESPIDLTPFNTLYITLHTNYADGNKTGITTAKNGSTFYVSAMTNTTSQTTLSLDVSNLNNVSGYLSVGNVYGAVVLYSAWFE